MVRITAIIAFVRYSTKGERIVANKPMTEGRAPRGLAAWPVIVGMAGFWSFFNSLIYPSAVFGSSQTASTFTVVASFALVIAGFVAGVFEAKRLLKNEMLARLLAVLGIACLAVFAAAALQPACILLFALVLGAFVALLGIGWAHVCEGVAQQGRDVAVPITLSLLVCNVIMVALSVAFPSTAQNQFVPVYAMLTLSCILCVWQLRAAGGASVSETPVRQVGGCAHFDRRTPVMLATLGLYLVGSGMLRGIYAADDSPASITGSLLHAGLLAVLLIASALYSYANARRGKPDRLPWVAFILLCVIALYVTVLFSGTLDYVSNELLLPTRPMAMLLVWAGAFALARETGRPAGFAVGCVALPLFGLGRIAVYTMWFLLQGSDVPPQLNATVLGTSFLLTVGVVAYLALPRPTDGGKDTGPAGPEAERSPLPEAGPLAGSLAELATRYALSERETQVLELLVAGNSRAKIAELLVLSVNSVQTYAKSLYRKLDVHSRQELIDLARGDSGANASDGHGGEQR